MSRSYALPDDDSDSTDALGPLMGARRPKYETLNDVLAPWIEMQPLGEELVIFINVPSILRHLFNDHALARLTRGELNRSPRNLTAELINIGAHYRNYVAKYFQRPSVVIFYYSSVPCAAKVAINPDFKSAMYSRRLEATAYVPVPEYESIRRYVAYNLRLTKVIMQRIPNMHLVDTRTIDPEAWPAALMNEGRVKGAALVVSSFDTDLQYAAGIPGQSLAYDTAVFRANGDHSRLVTADTTIMEFMRASKAKTATDLTLVLAPAHIVYLLALTGDESVSVDGVQKMGVIRSGSFVAKGVASGRLPPDAPSLQALLDEGGLPEGAEDVVRRAWGTLIHHTYVGTVSPAEMALVDQDIVNLSGLGELERVNAEQFNGRLNLEMAFAGEASY